MTSERSNRPLTEEEVLHIAHLARLELSKEEITGYQSDLAEILTYVNTLQKLDTSGIEATFFTGASCNVMSDDCIEPSMTTEDILANAPDHEQACIRMPRILGDD